MVFTIDYIRVKNTSELMPEYDIIAEMGISVDTFSDYLYESGEDDIRKTIERLDRETQVTDGYYYVTIIREKDNWSDIKSTYIVSLSSVYDYLYGYTAKEDVPQPIERYSRLEDAVKSDFIDHFLRLEKLMEDTITQKRHNISTRLLDYDSTGFEIDIQIESIDVFEIQARSKLNSPDEVSFELKISSDNGFNIDGHIFPGMMYTLCDKGKKEYFYSLRDVGCHKFFRGLFELEQFAVKELYKYFDESDLKTRMAEADFASLRYAILHTCLGEIIEQ